MQQTDSIIEIAHRAKQAAGLLSETNSSARRHALQAMAQSLLDDQSMQLILSANKEDLDRATNDNQISKPALSRLSLDESKLKTLASGIEQIAELEDPLGQVTLARRLDDGLMLERIVCPIGVIAVIFESRPDVLPQIAALCIKTSNAVLLKGGSEALKTNQQLFKCIERALTKCGMPVHSLSLLSTREEMQQLLTADRFIDLIIPRGSNKLVRQIQSSTHIPVLGHADGVCHLYVDKDANLKQAITIAVDAKTQYPAACNSIETLLVHESVAEAFLPDLIAAMKSNGVMLRARSETVHERNLQDVQAVDDLDFSFEYGEKTLALHVVPSTAAAIEHINHFGSHHTDTIASENEATFDQFFKQVNSAGVYWNASTRFADGYRYGFGAEVGISTGKLHPRGPVGIEGLITYKYKLRGNGHIVSTYVGDNARKFTHETLD